MNIIKNLNKQIILWKKGLEFAPWERWSVYVEDDRDHFVSGNYHFSITKFSAWLWAIVNIGNKRNWKLIRQKRIAIGVYSK